MDKYYSCLSLNTFSATPSKYSRMMLFMFSIALCIITPNLMQANASFVSPSPNAGDWIVSNETHIENKTITLNGNLIIQSGGVLTFHNVVLKINSTYNGQYRIEVQAGGIFNLTASTITSCSAAHYDFYFLRGSSGCIRQSIVEKCGYAGSGSYGIKILSSNVEIDNSTIRESYYGIWIYEASPKITNNNIINNTHAGIVLHYSSNAVLINNHVEFSKYGIYAISSNFTLINSTVVNSSEYDIYPIDAYPTIVNTVYSRIYLSGNFTACIGNYVRVKVVGSDGKTPVAGADVLIRNGNNVVYATPGYGGNDSKTDSNGLTEYVMVTARIITPTIELEKETYISVKYGDWEEVRKVNMSTTHTEVFQVSDYNQTFPKNSDFNMWLLFSGCVVGIIATIAIVLMQRKKWRK